MVKDPGKNREPRGDPADRIARQPTVTLGVHPEYLDTVV